MGQASNDQLDATAFQVPSKTEMAPWSPELEVAAPSQVSEWSLVREPCLLGELMAVALGDGG